MFAPQLLKLVNRLIEMTEAELVLLKDMNVKDTARISTEKEPLIVLYQNCTDKIKTDEKTRKTLKAWEHFPLLKERVAALGDLSEEHGIYIKRIEQSQSNFVSMMQEKMLSVVQPIKNYNNRGHMVNRQQYYARQGGGATSTLDQAL